MNFSSSIVLKDPSKAKIRKSKSSHHEYVIPSNFTTIPTNLTQSRIMKTARLNTFQKMPKLLEEDDDTEDDDEHMPKTPIDGDDENIPLAMLAFQKGFIIPDKVENVYPLIQHVPQKTPSNCIYEKHSHMHAYYTNKYAFSAEISPLMHQPRKFSQQVASNPLNPNNFYATSSPNSSFPSLSSTSEVVPISYAREHRQEATEVYRTFTYHR